MIGYAMVWLFWGFFLLLFLATVLGYYSARFVYWLKNYWMGR